MALVHRCPKCGTYFTFHKWHAPAPAGEALAITIDEEIPAEALPDSLTWYGRGAALALVTVWGAFLAAADYRGPPEGFSFMHSILLPIHESGHVFFRLLGDRR